MNINLLNQDMQNKDIFDPATWDMRNAVEKGIAASQAQIDANNMAIPSGADIANEQLVEGMNQSKAQYNLQQEEAKLQQAVANILSARQQQEQEGQQAQQTLMRMFPGYTQSSDDKYYSAYNQLVGSGVDKNVAHNIASREANKYRADRLGLMQAVMGTPGIAINEQGMFTPIGQQLLYQMQNEDPESAAIYAKVADMPTAGYAMQRQQDMARFNADLAFENDERKYNRQIQRMIDAGLDPEDAVAVAAGVYGILNPGLLGGGGGGRGGGRGRGRQSSGGDGSYLFDESGRKIYSNLSDKERKELKDLAGLHEEWVARNPDANPNSSPYLRRMQQLDAKASMAGQYRYDIDPNDPDTMGDAIQKFYDGTRNGNSYNLARQLLLEGYSAGDIYERIADSYEDREEGEAVADEIMSTVLRNVETSEEGEGAKIDNTPVRRRAENKPIENEPIVEYGVENLVSPYSGDYEDVNDEVVQAGEDKPSGGKSWFDLLFKPRQ